MANYCNVILYLSTTLCIAIQNLSKSVNVVCDGSPSLILIVLLISFGITTRPRSSILLTIPVAFIYKNSFVDLITLLLSVNKGVLYGKKDLIFYTVSILFITNFLKAYFFYKKLMKYHNLHLRTAYQVFLQVYKQQLSVG